MTESTDADREKAAATLNYGPDEQVSPMDAEYVDAIAAALAAERAAAVADLREFAAKELRKAAEDWDDLSVTGEYAADEASSFLRRRADALTAGDPA